MEYYYFDVQMFALFCSQTVEVMKMRVGLKGVKERSKRVSLGQGLLLYFGGTRLLCVSAFEPLNRLFSSSRVHS